MKSGSEVQAIRRRRDVLVATFLFVATGSFVLWQNSRVAVLWDLGYLLNTSWRIALGQIPYRDFSLVHPPLTFLIQAALMRSFGRIYLVPVIYTAVISGLGTILAWRILLHALRGRIASASLVSLFLALPVVFLGIYGVYPHPIYDCDCAFAILVSLSLLQRLNQAQVSTRSWPRTWLFPLCAGASVVVPAFFKQNMGLPFLLAVTLGLFLLLLRNQLVPRVHTQPISEPSNLTLLTVFAGIVVSLLLAAVLLNSWVGIDRYLHWTVDFAAERRLPGLASMVEVYRQPSFLWTLPALGIGLILLHSRFSSRPFSRIAASMLCAAPFIGSIVYLLLQDDLDERADNLLSLWPLILVVAALSALFALRRGLTLPRLMPFFVLAAIHGTFLSQQLWGSTYAIWPLLLILAAYMLGELPRSLRQIPLALAAVISATFLICGSLYALSHERLNYIQLDADDTQIPLTRATFPALRGMTARGPFLSDFDELLRFASAEIPPQDAVLLLPGEEPFYYASGRAPLFPVILFDHTTDPYSDTELFDEVRRRDIRWIIIKRHLQLNEDPLPDRDQVYGRIAQEFVLHRKLTAYEVYRKR